MAVFTNKYDREAVPILVQLAQIDTQEESEIAHAVRLVLGEAPGPDNISGIVIQACDIVKETFAALLTGPHIPAHCIGWAVTFLVTTAEVLEIDHNSPRYTPGDSVHNHYGEMIPLGDLSWQTLHFGERGFAEVVANEMQWLLHAAWYENQFKSDVGAVVGACPECGFPMLHPTAKHIYCSRRCADRVGQRKRRGSKNASHVSIK